MVSISKGNRKNKANRKQGILQLLWIILWAIVVVVLGLYGGLASSHHHSLWRSRNTKHKQAVCTYLDRYSLVAFVWRFGIDSN
jgi:hypothetical protein